MRTSINKCFVALLQCWSLIDYAGADLTQDIPDIGITQDYFTGDDAAIKSFSVILALQPGSDGKPQNIEDGSLIGIANKAFREMRAHPDRVGLSLGSVTLLAVGNEIMLASSQRYLPSAWVAEHGSKPLAVTLGGAQIEARYGLAHQHADGCGEINVLNLYLQQHPGETLEGTNARMVTWCLYAGGGMGVCNPCTGTQGRYGCYTMLNQVGLKKDPPWFTLIDKKTQYTNKISHLVRWTAMHTRAPAVTEVDTETSDQTVNWVGEHEAEFFADEEYGG